MNLLTLSHNTTFILKNYLQENIRTAWLGHGAFALWLAEKHQPKTFVELGTHNGFSYFAFCHALNKLKYDKKCYAIDTWQGDEHAGKYSEEVYEFVNRYNNKHFHDFSTLMRGYFDDYVEHFDDDSIELLHIDGLHTYEAVKHDFETWLPKVCKKRGIILFHDTHEQREVFGVHILWNELKQQYPFFEFSHSYGLGVLLVGDNYDSAIMELIDLKDNNIISCQNYFEFQTLDHINLKQTQAQTVELNEKLKNAEKTIKQLQDIVDKKEKEIQSINQSHKDMSKILNDTKKAFEDNQKTLADTQDKLKNTQGKLSETEKTLNMKQKSLDKSQQEYGDELAKKQELEHKIKTSKKLSTRRALKALFSKSYRKSFIQCK